MRLLNVRTLELKEYPGGSRTFPPYAILSHTWGTEEVTFDDLGRVPLEDRISAAKNGRTAGWKKINYSCDQAGHDGLSYVWIDTCCIDKSSSSELSEAINSMFAWYSNATVCYAYLEDAEDSTFEKMEGAKWFKRGWTLQELLAPSKVEFYGKNWVYLNEKDTKSKEITEFVRMLGKITKIDPLVLWKPAFIGAKSVAVRMSWASMRETTRLEDIAYCLLGLFDVNIPLLYGEGERAFSRLQEEIIKTTDDHSIFAWDRPQGNSDQKGRNNSVISNEKRDSVRSKEDVGPMSCLARAPSYFDRGALVVPFGKKQASIPFTITNQGLQIKLPILKRKDSDIVFGLINCHWETSFSECIGIPLQGSLEANIFERASCHRMENIPKDEIELAQKNRKTIFIRIRTPKELPFAAEMNLQVYDQLLRKYRFGHPKPINNPMSSSHANMTCQSIRLRWLSGFQSPSDAVRSEMVILLWELRDYSDFRLAVCIQGTIDDRGNDGLGIFKAVRMRMEGCVRYSDAWLDSFIQSLADDRSRPGKVIDARCVLQFHGRPIEVAVQLETNVVFGNDVHDLKFSYIGG